MRSSAPLPRRALRTAIETVRPLGKIVQVGVAGDLPVSVNLVVSKEIDLKGTHRFHAEFAEAVRLIDSGAIDVGPIITHSYPLERAQEAFEMAADRSRAVKITADIRQLKRGSAPYAGRIGGAFLEAAVTLVGR